MKKYVKHLFFFVWLFLIPLNMVYSDQCSSTVFSHNEGVQNCGNTCASYKSYIDAFQLDGNYYFGESPGIREQYGDVGFVVAPCFCPCQVLPQLDFSYYQLEDGGWGTNTLVGFVFGSSENSYGGGYISYDFMNGKFCNFHQVGFGFELIGDSFEFRLNSYIPVGASRGKGSITVFDDYDNFGYVTPFRVEIYSVEYALTGLDTEFGPRISCYCVDAFLGAGPYYYKHQDFGDYLGIRGVLRVNVFDYFYCSAQITHDKFNRTLKRGVVGLSVPLGLLSKICCAKTSQNCNLSNSFYRDKPIHIESCCKYKINW